MEELIALAKDMKKAGEQYNLNEDERAFYDALAVDDSAVQVLGEPTLKTIARELMQAVKNNVTIDWTVRENVRANLRVIVKRILRKFGYPPPNRSGRRRRCLSRRKCCRRGGRQRSSATIL
jgi:type I restriction enzyme, R subunit